jgi:hypothetical protein
MSRSSTLKVALTAFWVTARFSPLASELMVSPPVAPLPMGLPVSRLVRETK